MKSLIFFRDPAGRRFAILIAFLALVFLTGGGSRADIQSLPLLRPAAVIACALGAFGLSAAHVREFRTIFAFFAASFALLLLHAVPLPPALWSALPGHALLAEADRLAGIDGAWRPLSLFPEATWNAFFSMFVPLAVFLLMIGLPPEYRYRVLTALVIACAVSAILGILQVIGPPGGPLYFYKIHSTGLATGLFANRNHAAFFLALVFPMLAVVAMRAKTDNEARLRLILCLVAAASIGPVILVAGSRLGLGLALINAIAAFALYRKPTDLRHRRGQERPLAPLFGVAAVAVAIALVAIAMSRTTAIDRLFSEAATGDLRFAIWQPSFEAAKAYFPFGSGLGGFAEVFEIFEPDTLLGPEYINHAHNDFLEVLMTAGLPGLVLMLVGLVYVARHSLRAWNTLGDRAGAKPYAPLGSAIVLSLLVGSLFDYPLRTPILASVFVIGLIWLQSETLGAGRKTG